MTRRARRRGQRASAGSNGARLCRRSFSRNTCKKPRGQALASARRPGGKAAPPPSLHPPRAEPRLPPESEVSRQIVRPAKWSPEGGQGRDVMIPAANPLRRPAWKAVLAGAERSNHWLRDPRRANRGAAAAAPERGVWFFPRNLAAESGAASLPGPGSAVRGR